MKRVIMRFLLLMFVMINTNVVADDVIYLTCVGQKTFLPTNTYDGTVTNDFLLDRTNKTITQVITGVTGKAADDLKQEYTETDTQIVSSITKMSLNKHTLEYSIPNAVGYSVAGKCKIKKQEL